MRKTTHDYASYSLPFPGKLLIDNFAGGGGASTGIRLAFGRDVDVAVNHDPEAIAMHMKNHPNTRHYCESVFDVDPVEATRGQSVACAWFSPDCTHHSRAKGGVPRSKKLRGLAWIILRWAVFTKPLVIFTENVIELTSWTELDAQGFPIKERSGETFQAFIAALTTGLAPGHPAYKEIRETLGPDFPYQHLYNGLGYDVEYRELSACDYGAPTIRRRLFIVMRRDGHPIKWPEITHGDPKSEAVRSGRLKPWRTAGECIDWSIPTKSIFGRQKPLAENTLKRIAKGMRKFVLDAEKPFIVPTPEAAVDRAAYLAKFRFDSAGSSLKAPLPTVTAGGRCERPAGAAHAMGLVVPTLLQQGHTGDTSSSRCHSPDTPFSTMTASREKSLLTAHLIGIDNKSSGDSAAWSADAPMRTTTTENRHALVVASMLQQNGGFYEGDGRPVDAPLSTITAKGSQQQLVTSHLLKFYGTCEHGVANDKPLPTITATGQHIGEVRSFLMKQYSQGGQHNDLNEPLHTVTTKDRFTLVNISLGTPEADEKREAVRAFAREFLGMDALITVINGVTYEVVDIGLRMLVPRELYRGQGFPDDYVIEFDYNGKPLSKSAQVRMCGNSVAPPVAEALVAANFAHELQVERVA